MFELKEQNALNPFEGINIETEISVIWHRIDWYYCLEACMLIRKEGS